MFGEYCKLMAGAPAFWTANHNNNFSWQHHTSHSLHSWICQCTNTILLAYIIVQTVYYWHILFTLKCTNTILHWEIANSHAAALRFQSPHLNRHIRFSNVKLVWSWLKLARYIHNVISFNVAHIQIINLGFVKSVSFQIIFTSWQFEFTRPYTYHIQFT